MKKWYHVECMHMSTPVYNALASSNISWHCVTCGMPNFSSSLFESFMVNTSNSFDQLSNCNVVVSPGLPAFMSSPIKPNRTDRNNYYKPRNTKVLVVNFQSIKNKKEELCNLLDSANPNILIGTETWLRNDINSFEIFPECYNVYRKDRWDSYGGVLVAVKTDYISELIDTENDTESIYIKISLYNNKSLIVGSIYRPPNSDINYVEKIKSTVDNVLRKNRTSVVWLGGDIVTFPTRKEHTLDVFLTNRPSLVNRCEPLPDIGDHDIVYIDSDITAKINKLVKRKIFIWKKANTTEQAEKARNININFFEKFDPDSSITEMWEFINSNLLHILEETVP